MSNENTRTLGGLYKAVALNSLTGPSLHDIIVLNISRNRGMGKNGDLWFLKS